VAEVEEVLVLVALVELVVQEWLFFGYQLQITQEQLQAHLQLLHQVLTLF
jgi:hypothetical protein